MKYKALDVARYIINYSNENNINITNLKLQKLLYYIQAAFVISKEGKVCFEENILNWEYGPVVEEVYNEFRFYGRDEIPKQESYMKIEFDEAARNIKRYKKFFDDTIIREEDKKIIKKIIEKYRNSTAVDLVKKTHEEEPWKASNRNDIIEIESIKEYFIENMKRIF